MLLLDPIAPLQDDDEVLPEDDETTFLLEEEGLLLLDPIAPLQDDDEALPEDDEAIFLLEEESFFPSLDPFDFADDELLLDPSLELRMTVLVEEDDSSSFTDVLLSPPQAVNEIKDERLKTRDKVAKNCFIGHPPQIKYTKFGQ